MSHETTPGKPRRHKLGSAEDFPIGAVRILNVDGTEVGVIRLSNGEFHAMRNYCPHKGAPICKGTVGGTWPPCEPQKLNYDLDGSVIVCPWHGYEYDIRSGIELYQKRPTRLRKYPVEVASNEVIITI